MDYRSLIAIGGNLTDKCGNSPLVVCQHAVSMIVANRDIQLIKRSAWFRSAPVPVSDQPAYINGVIEVFTSKTPRLLLQALQTIEISAGRVRGQRNAARVLDLDILAIDSLVMNEPGLTLPHPRLAERAFVLRPLSEIAPDWLHPTLNVSAAELSARITDQAIERLPLDDEMLT